MARFYVDITGVSQDYLDFLGYFVVAEDDEFKIIDHKGDVHFIDKKKPYLYIDDMNDANLLKGPFVARAQILLPPPKNGQN
jgi:hypothetical protein